MPSATIISAARTNAAAVNEGPPNRGVQISWVENSIKQVLKLDAALEERHSFDSEVTDHPVETGFNATDNSRAKPGELTVEGLIVDFPLSIRGGGIGEKGSVGRSSAEFIRLDTVRQNGTLLDVRTGLKTYKNMVIKSMTVPRNKDTKGAVRVSITFQEIRIVESKSVPIRRAKENKGTGKDKKGDKNGKAATPAEQGESVLHVGKEGVVNFVKSFSGG